MIIVFLIMYIFAICAVNLLKGKSFYCDTTNIVDISLKQLEQTIKTSEDCTNLGGKWKRYDNHFDNI